MPVRAPWCRDVQAGEGRRGQARAAKGSEGAAKDAEPHGHSRSASALAKVLRPL
jgi:hypothetical protein